MSQLLIVTNIDSYDISHNTIHLCSICTKFLSYGH